MLGLSYFYGGFLVGPQVISCHVIMQIGNLIVKGLYLDCELFLFFFMFRSIRARETRDARNEVPLPSRVFSQARGYLRVSCI